MGLKLPDIRLTDEEKPRKNLTQETCPDRGSNPGPLRDKRACYHLYHSGGLLSSWRTMYPHFSGSTLMKITGFPSPIKHHGMDSEITWIIMEKMYPRN